MQGITWAVILAADSTYAREVVPFQKGFTVGTTILVSGAKPGWMDYC